MKAVAFLFVCITVAGAAHVAQVADKGFLVKQKAVYELFWHVDQPTVYHPELYQKARSFSIEDHIDMYANKTAVTEFLHMLKHGMLPRGEVFSIAYPHHHDEAVTLYHLLHTAKDFDTFYNTAVWARFHVNEQMYIFALTLAVIHRADTKYVHVPPLYEVLPNFFFNDDVLHQAYHVAMGDTGFKKTMGGVDYHVIHANYSGWYLVHPENDEQKLAYFTEDVGLNSHYFMYMNEMPYWLTTEQAHVPTEVRGEWYFFWHKQLLQRYYLERLSNDLGEIDFVDFDSPVPDGYYPNMHFHNGLPFPQRHSDAVIPLDKKVYVQVIKELETRIGNAIDSGFVLDKQGNKVNIYTPLGLGILGNIVQGNADVLNKFFYGDYESMCRHVLGFGLEPTSKYQIAPSSLEIYSTSMRDPVFYSMYKRIVNFYHRYKAHLPHYTEEELSFPGVKIESVTVDKLMTYFDHFESLLNNALSVHSHKDAQGTIVKARQHRLNHKPFTYHITVNSDKTTKAAVRVFLGPKYDEHGHELDITENHVNFMEIDQWIVDLKSGVNKIERSSHESIYVASDEPASEVFYKQLVKSLESGEQFQIQHQLSGFPERLQLPKGKKEGMPFKLFFHVAPCDAGKIFKIDSPVWGTVVVDNRPMGFPLDRHVHTDTLALPNAMFKDVLVFHKQLDELNVTV